MDAEQLEYVGFWPRVGASLVDTLLVLVVVIPLSMVLLGSTDFGHDSLGGILIGDVLPALAVIAFWLARQATPGKMMIGARIVDARSGAAPTVVQCLLRYLGYFVSTIPFGIGLIWVAFDPRKQGWHDKIAGTVVVRPQRREVAAVRFSGDRTAPPSTTDGAAGGHWRP